jgi:hypothetical protein
MAQRAASLAPAITCARCLVGINAGALRSRADTAMGAGGLQASALPRASAAPTLMLGLLLMEEEHMMSAPARPGPARPRPAPPPRPCQRGGHPTLGGSQASLLRSRPRPFSSWHAPPCLPLEPFPGPRCSPPPAKQHAQQFADRAQAQVMGAPVCWDTLRGATALGAPQAAGRGRAATARLWVL